MLIRRPCFRKLNMDTRYKTGLSRGPADAAVFAAAYDAWCGGGELRRARSRYKDFTYGRQWGDMVETPSGHILTEGEYSRISGRTPQTNNIIRQLVKTIVGRFRASLRESDRAEAICPGISPEEREELRRVNALDELDARMLEEFLISGCAVQKVVCERRLHDSRERVWVDNVSPSRFFVNRFRDPRGWDIELVGMLHDMSLTEAVMRFSHGDETRRNDIVKAFAYTDGPSGIGSGGASLGGVEGVDFHLPAQGRCRVIEVWTLVSREVLRLRDTSRGMDLMVDADQEERVNRINANRKRQGRKAIESSRETTLVWRFRFFAPDGTLLDSGLSPYAHGSHPFVVKFFPMTDGEVHSFVEDVVDQQRHVNRLLTLIDHIMTFSAKGVLLYPTTVKPKEYSWEKIVSEWSCCNGVVPYKPSGDAKPMQVVSTGADAGAHKLLSLELQLLDRISGVSGALRGENSDSKEGVALYESRVENSMIALLDVIDSFNAFRTDRDAKMGMARLV